MSAKSFVAITSEGGMLPVDFLQELVSPRTAVDGLSPASYHLAEGERISEQVNRSWNRLKGCWANFRKATADKKPGDPTTSETRERWLQPLFQELGFGQKLPSAKPIEIEGRLYPVSHGWGSVPMHLVGSHVDIDRRTPGAIGAAKASPHSLVQQTLNASDAHTWGMVSNGLVLRLLRDNVTLTRMAYLEWDLAAIFDGDLYSEFFLLWLLCHQSRFEGERPDQCWLEKWKKEAADKSFRALEDLRPGVEKAISSLGEGLMSHPANKELLTKLQSGALDQQEFYRQILRVVYRMIFLFAAEDRGLLHPPLPENDSDAEAAALKARQRYQNFYSLSRLRQRSMYRTGTPHPDLWVSFQLVTQKLGSDAGSPELALPPLGSFLWQGDRSTPDLYGCLISNRHFLCAVQSLAFVKSNGVRRSVDYRNLGAEEIGAVYEGLLELHPKVNADLGTFELDTAAGNERKTSGSYYTADSLVQCLLDSALDPVIDQAVAGKSGENAAEAILSLKVCDPAVGSGHFLIAAAHRMARRVAAARTGEEEPSPEASRAALRDVIGRCLYGVDINPMSAELCRVSLWLDALEPGKPLSFLDHHIQVGNSLLGATPRGIQEGIPDEAFKPTVGDDPEFCKAAKKQNKEERRGQLQLFRGNEAASQGDTTRLRAALREVESMSDATPSALHAKRERYEKLLGSDEYGNNRLIADAWCAAFVWKKCKGVDGGFEYTITDEVFRNIKLNPGDCPEWMRAEITRLREQYQFFHWQLAFPEVFAPSKAGEQRANEQTGWTGGFDVMLGNPPWENIKADPVEYFASSAPEVAAAPNADARDAAIELLVSSAPYLLRQWENYQRYIAGQQHLISNSGNFPFGAHGKCNTMPLFLEMFSMMASERGQAGIIVKSVIGTDAEYQPIFTHLVESERLLAFLDFVNERGLFPAVHRQERFALIALAPTKTVPKGTYAFRLEATADLNDKARLLSLGTDELKAMANGSCRLPTITDIAQTRLLIKAAVNAGAAFLSDATGVDSYIMLDGGKVGSAPGYCTTESFESRDGSNVLGVNATGEEVVAVYEGKLFGILDHRYRTFEGVAAKARYGKTPATEKLSDDAKRNPWRTLEPRYWVSHQFVTEKLRAKGWNHGWLALHGRKGNRDNQRTFSVSIVPMCAAVDVAPILLPRSSTDDFRRLIAAVAVGQCFLFDYLVRSRLIGFSIGKNLLEEIPAPEWQSLSGECQWLRAQTVSEWLLLRVLELTYTAWDLEPFAHDCGWHGPPFRWDQERRFLARCELDAAFFHLYGLSREDAAYVLDTFSIVKRKDEEKYGTYRTKDTILEIYDELKAAMDSRQTYQTRLDPPPGPPIGKDGKFVRYEDIASNPPPHIHLPRNAKPPNNEWQLADLAREFPRGSFKVRASMTGAALNAKSAKPASLSSGCHVVVAHPELKRGQSKVPVAMGRVTAIANRTDAGSGESFVYLAIQDGNGVTELRVPTKEWNSFEAIGVIEEA